MAAAVIAIVTGYLMISGFGAGKVYYHTVDEFVQLPRPSQEQFVRVSGVVAPGTIQWEPTQVRLQFVLASADGGTATLPVRYDKVKPDLLQDNVPVVVEGHLGSDGSLVAERVLVKCPSKYEAAGEV